MMGNFRGRSPALWGGRTGQKEKPGHSSPNPWSLLFAVVGTIVIVAEDQIIDIGNVVIHHAASSFRFFICI